MDRSSTLVFSERFAAHAADWIAGRLTAVVAARGRATIALCGGNTPAAVYQELATRAVPWEKITIFFGDERAVPPDSPDSNYAMARRTLIDLLPAHGSVVHRMEAERADLAAAARDYAALLPATLDLLLLGIGPDGHTASIFPHSEAFHAQSARVIGVAAPATPLKPSVARMTITPSVISVAREIAILVTGADKAHVVARIFDDTYIPETLPAQLARHGQWLLDTASASLL
jgi:6-phosphogluconolactonase